MAPPHRTLWTKLVGICCTGAQDPNAQGRVRLRLRAYTYVHVSLTDRSK